MDVLQRVTLAVPAKNQRWTDSGVTIGEGETLRVTATGPVKYGVGGDGTRYAFPEGAYPDYNDSNHSYDPTAVQTWGSKNRALFAASNIALFSLAIALTDDATAPSNGIGDAINNALQGDRDAIYEGVSGRVWLIFNDRTTSDNTREFRVTVERLGAFDALSPGQVSPVRWVPPALAQIKARPVAPTALCWFIQPARGPAEGYTEYDVPLPCPAYTDATGLDENDEPLWTNVPALTYQPFSGLGITGVPTSVKLGVDAPDVSVVAFNLGKLRREYYEDAWVEVFEVPLDATARFAASGDPLRSNRTIFLTGKLGNAQGTDADAQGLGAATIELTPFDELLNIPIGQTIGPLCDVGRIVGESWGCGRCRNEVLNDGPSAEMWTRGARVDAIAGTSKLRLSAQNVDGKSGYESDFPASHGILQFRGGALDGLRRNIGRFTPAGGEIILRRAVPEQPAIGDLVWLTAGCDKTLDGPQGCTFWNNVANFRGQPFVPGRGALTRRYTT